jgi:hypothetical protein
MSSAFSLTPQVSCLKSPLRQGRDWEAELKQRAKEVSLMRELGLSIDSTSLSPGEVTDDEDIAV